jgi:AcrR family transcriptional regulator
MDTQDRRVKRTQSALAKALMTLTLEKGYDAITIRDITERADIGYATFFRHYADKDALLQDAVDVILEEMIELLDPATADSDPEGLGTKIFVYVREHSEVCRVLLSSWGKTTLLERLLPKAVTSALETRPPLPDSVVPPEIAAYHLVSSAISLIDWWLNHDMPYPPERMGLIYADLIVRPTNAIAFR